MCAGRRSSGAMTLPLSPIRSTCACTSEGWAKPVPRRWRPRCCTTTVVISPHRSGDERSALLGANEITLIYPEMGRNPEGIGEFLTWAADVALASGAAILPCYIHGTTRGHLGPARLVVGSEIEPSGDAATLTERLFINVTSLGVNRRSGANP